MISGSAELDTKLIHTGYCVFFAGNTIVVLTNGFKKKSQKTPMNEIEIAENFKKDYLRRMK